MTRLTEKLEVVVWVALMAAATACLAMLVVLFISLSIDIVRL